MKKILCLFGALALTLTSCSKDDDNTNGNNIVLPKTIKLTNTDYPTENKTSTFTYDGNKIVSISNQTGRTEFTYTGNLITQKVNYYMSGNQAVKYAETSFTYLNGKLANVNRTSNGNVSREVYSYNSDGTVTEDKYLTDKNTGVESKLSTSLLTLVNGNLTKIVSTTSNDVTTNVLDYDTKNNVFKNILGFTSLLDQGIVSSLGQDIYSSVNNIEKYNRSSSSPNSSPDIYNAKFDYNAAGYPIKQTSYNQDGTVKEVFDYTY